MSTVSGVCLKFCKISGNIFDRFLVSIVKTITFVDNLCSGGAKLIELLRSQSDVILIFSLVPCEYVMNFNAVYADDTR